MPPSLSRRIERTARVAPELAGFRFDKAAARLFTEFSRSQIADWIRSGDLKIDGRCAVPKEKLRGGECLSLDTRLEAPRWDAPQAEVAFRIVFEDDHLLVVDKPPGLVVHPGAGNVDRTLVNGLIARRPALGELPRAGIVHRLDKDTGGLLIVAATRVTQLKLARALARHAIGRRYVAIVEGVLTGGRIIDAPIERDPHNRLRQRVGEGGRRAVTTISLIERFRAASMIRAELETGRTHQIRVHMASIGHPLVGDRRYGARGRLPPRPTLALIDVMRAFNRQALHAAQLEFEHPVTGEALTFESPLPADLENLIDVLREDRDHAHSA